jgi:hypothetical protein
MGLAGFKTKPGPPGLTPMPPACRGNKISFFTKNMALQAIFSWRPQVAGANPALQA